MKTTIRVIYSLSVLPFTLAGMFYSFVREAFQRGCKAGEMFLELF